MANEEQPATLTKVLDSSKFHEFISPYYLDQTFADIELILEDQTVYAHKVILAARSRFFGTLLKADPKLSKLTLTKVFSNPFKEVLKYIYTGCINIVSSDGNLIFEVLKLAHEYSLSTLEEALSQKMTTFLSKANICAILNDANLYDMSYLRDVCHSFIDDHTAELVKKDFFISLTQKSMIKLLERDAFPVEEIDIFKIVANWRQTNTDQDNLVTQCVRLSYLNKNDLFNVVRPSKLIDNDQLLNTLMVVEEEKSKVPKRRPGLMKKIGNETSALRVENVVTDESNDPTTGDQEVLSRFFQERKKLFTDKESLRVDAEIPEDQIQKLLNINIASSKYNAKVISECIYSMAKVISGINTHDLLEGIKKTQYAYHHIKDKTGITVDLGVLSKFNTIEMQLADKERKVYRYYIEVSTDQKQIIDYSQYDCRSNQRLCFEEQTARYIRVVGTYSHAHTIFALLKLKVYLWSHLPNFQNQILIASYPKFVCNEITPPSILNDSKPSKRCVLVHLTQPQILNRLRFQIPGEDSICLVETSMKSTQWEIVSEEITQKDNNNWQIIFKERPIIYIRLTGTFSPYTVLPSCLNIRFTW